MSENTRFLPMANGPWRGVPMNSLRLYTIWLNKSPRPDYAAPPNPPNPKENDRWAK